MCDKFRKKKKSKKTIVIKVRLDTTSWVRREWAMTGEGDKEGFWGAGNGPG